MPAEDHKALRAVLDAKKSELEARLERIKANVRRGYDADSKERAQEFENREVVDALGNEARRELAKISAALMRMESGDYGACIECGEAIASRRLEAYPYADLCIDCAREESQRG